MKKEKRRLIRIWKRAEAQTEEAGGEEGEKKDK